MPHVPPVVDEAANTPSWVPLIGLLLLALAGLWLVYRVATAEDDKPPAEIVPEGEAAEGAAAGDENAGPNAPAPTPAPAAAPAPAVPVPMPVPRPMAPPMPPPGAAPQGH
jgi:hypothetical protein